MEFNVINTFSDKEIIGSTYADLYVHYRDYIPESSKSKNLKHSSTTVQNHTDDSWKSPSDLLIRLIKLKPPISSKIIKSKAHKGILEIGDGLLQSEHQEFLDKLTKIVNENDDCWKFVLKNEKDEIFKKIKVDYENIFETKRKIMIKEMTSFYESSLLELESHIKTEVRNMLHSLHAGMISDLNYQIYSNLQNEKQKLDEILVRKYEYEEQKVEKYYALLLNNEVNRAEQLLKNAICKNNHVICNFYEQILRERVTSTMYVMCNERRKCKVTKILLEKFYSNEVLDIIQKLKEKRAVLDTFKNKEFGLYDIDKNWEKNMQKVLIFFNKFIAFALELLPEQAQFLIELEKMVHLQLEDIKSNAESISSILINENNLLQFYKLDSNDPTCDKEPFTVDGDLSDKPIKIYGSRETLPDDVDLPFFRLQRQFIYAKCHGFEDIRKYLESQSCKCHQQPSKKPSNISMSTQQSGSKETYLSNSTDEHYLLEDINRLDDCPVRKCNDLIKICSFPYLSSYFDYTDENFTRVEAILGVKFESNTKPLSLRPRDIVDYDLPFAETKEKYRNMGTQFTDEEDCNVDQICPCIQSAVENKLNNRTKHNFLLQSTCDVSAKRKKMVREIYLKYPELLETLKKHGVTF